MTLALLPPPTPSGPTTDLLAVIAAGLARSVTGSEPPLAPGQDRAYARLLATPQYEAWLIAWAPAGGLDLHDHGGSEGVVYVVSGQLAEAYVDPGPGGTLRTRVLSEGATVDVPAPRVHEVWNPGPGGPQRARLLSATDFDDVLRPRCRRRVGAVGYPPRGRRLAQGTAAPVTVRIDQLLAEARAGLPPAHAGGAAGAAGRRRPDRRHPAGRATQP